MKICGFGWEGGNEEELDAGKGVVMQSIYLQDPVTVCLSEEEIP